MYISYLGVQDFSVYTNIYWQGEDEQLLYMFLGVILFYFRSFYFWNNSALRLFKLFICKGV